MCGLSGEIRFDGEPADVAAVDRHLGGDGAPRPGRPRPLARGPGGTGPPAARHHRSVARPARSRWWMRNCGWSRCSTAASTTTSNCARSCRATATGSSPRPTPRSSPRPTTAGACTASIISSGCSPSRMLEQDTGRLVLGRDRLGIKPLYLSQTGDRLRFASSLPALLAGGDVDTSIDPVALNHYMTLPCGGAGADDDPVRGAETAAGDRPDDRTRRPLHRPDLLVARAQPGRRSTQV